MKQSIPNLEGIIQNYPWVEPFLAQLNPLLMVLLKMLLPYMLRKVCEKEGHISKNDLNASLLTKLAIFMVSQSQSEKYIPFG